MTDTPETIEHQKPRPTVMTAFVLAVVLIAYPLIYCSGFTGELVRPIIVDNSRTHWWYFWLANMAYHWVPFVLVWLTLRRECQPWSSIGVDWMWFWRKRWWIGITIGLLGIASYFMPSVHYGSELPGQSQTIFLAPVSAVERLWVIWGAITAAVTEEVLFRGFAITRLRIYLRSVWLSLVVSVISFVFIHGTPRSPEQAVSYIVAGFAFGVPFILMRQRRLEVLIVIHFLIDATLVLAP